MTLNDLLCECVVFTQSTPVVREVLQTIERNTVCTSNQCFESETDAFGVYVPPNTDQATITDSLLSFALCVLPIFTFLCLAGAFPSGKQRPKENGACLVSEG